MKLKEGFNETKRNLKMSWNFVKKRKKSLVIMIILSALISIISVIVPVLSAKLLLNLSNGNLSDLILVAIFIFIVEVTRNFVSFFLNRVTTLYMIKTVTDVQLNMFLETLNIETSEIDKNTSGTFIDRINNDTNDIINIFSDVISSFIDFVSNLGILVAIIFINQIMFVYFIITSLIIAYIGKKRRKLFFERSKKYRKIQEKRTGLISEIIRGIRDVKLLGAKDGIIKKTKKQLDSINKERILMSKTSINYCLFSNSVRDFFDVTFIILGTILVSVNSLSIANFIILHTYKGRVEGLLGFYDRLAELLKNYNLSATRVFEVLGNKFIKESDGGKIIDSVDGSIEFKNVNFSYDEDIVLNNINFKINAGEKVGFVGASGSGKSTIFNLLTRLYNFTDGYIFIDNIDIRDISIVSLRRNISLISQSPYIFNFSILDNLKIGNPNVSFEDVIEACRKAQIYDRIMEFDNGFEAVVGEGGTVLSGGEKQRLAIARSLLKKSNIILFDEATSALDNITQDKVQKAIYGLDKSKTVLIIAHRLSTVINCDKIVVVDKGCIVDIGTHNELLSRCSKYKDLFKYESAK